MHAFTQNLENHFIHPLRIPLTWPLRAQVISLSVIKHAARVKESSNVALNTMRSRRQLHSSPQLPLDVWQRIASHLSTKEWARIGRVCRATRMCSSGTLTWRSQARTLSCIDISFTGGLTLTCTDIIRTIRYNAPLLAAWDET